MREYVSPILWIVAFQVISCFIGITIYKAGAEWYNTLTPPPATPSDIGFMLSRGFLYIFIALSGWKMWRHRHNSEGEFRLIIFAIYLVLITTSPFIFFSAHLILPCLLWLVLVNFTTLILIAKSWDDARLASYFMFPPLLWTLYSAYLMAGFWWLNA